MKKVLLVGHDGAQLDSIVETLIKNQDVEVIIVSERPSLRANDRVRWVYCDVFSIDDLVRVMDGVDTVYFLQKISSLPLELVQGKEEDIELLLKTNLLFATQQAKIDKVFMVESTPDEIENVFQKIMIEKKRDVRSIQKFVLPPKKNANWVGEEYFKWLPRFFSNIIKVHYDGKECSFFLFNEMICILKLRRSPVMYPGRISFKVIGGLLNGKKSEGRLEFVETLDQQYVFGALHNFIPALPWFLYRFTQAIVHVLVMGAFGEHLKWCYLIGERK